jgi:hypothetical protein
VPAGERSCRWAATALVAIFLVSRALYFAAGIRFNADPISKFWQMIDPRLMRDDLPRSIWYLHMQPPGYNLAVGLLVRTFPASYGTIMWSIHLAIGIGIALALLRLMSLLGVSPLPATILISLFMVSPGCILFETEAVYEYPILLLLVVSAVVLLRFLRSGSTGLSIAFFACMLALELIRNSFHPIYVAIVAGGFLWLMPGLRRAVVIGALVALFPALAICLKNQMLFGRFTLSTWAGMATGVTTSYQLSPKESDDLIRRGIVSPLAKIVPFSELSAYYPYIRMPAKTGVPVLDEEITSTGHPNFNHLAYLQIHDMYLADSEAIWLHYPVAYARSVAIAWFSYFLPASDLHYFDRRLAPIRRWDRIYSAAVFGQFRRAESRQDLRALAASGRSFLLPLYMGLYLVVLVPAAVVWAGSQLTFRRNYWSSPESIVIAFMVFTIVFISLLSTMLSSFECNRYRFPLDGFLLVLTALMISGGARRIRLLTGRW